MTERRHDQPESSPDDELEADEQPITWTTDEDASTSSGEADEAEDEELEELEEFDDRERGRVAERRPAGRDRLGRQRTPKPTKSAPTAAELAVRITDRASQVFVLVTVGVFVLILVNGLAFGSNGFLAAKATPTPTATATPTATVPASATPAASASASPASSPTPTASATTSPAPSASVAPSASESPATSAAPSPSAS